MRYLKDNIIKNHYDVIIIGSGLGGLTAGALLAKKGFKVLICEQWYIPGGCCTAIKREGAYIDVGTALFYGFGKIGYNIHRFVHNTLEEPIDMIQHPGIFRMKWPGHSVTFWKDFDKFLKELSNAFPESAEELKAFYDYLWGFYYNFMDLLRGPEGDALPASLLEVKKYILKNALKHPFRSLKIASLMKKSAKDLMEKFTSNPDIPKFYDMLFAMLFCTHSEEAPGALLPPIFIETHTGGACYPVGSPQQVPNHLENALERFGGEILLRHQVKEIMFDGSTAVGVELDDGTNIRAKFIIANVNVWHLYGKLIKPEMISEKKKNQVMNWQPTVGTFEIFLTLDAEVIPDDIHEVELYLNKLGFDMTDFSTCIFLPSKNEPSIVPEGLHSMTVLSPGNDDIWPSPEDPDYQSDAYYKRKEEWANKILDVIEQHIPNLRKHIRSMDISTISTMERITNKIRGNIGGVKMCLGQLFTQRPQAKTEFKNLFMCGDSTTQGEGGVTCTASGVSAANLILRDNKMKEYILWPKGKEYVSIIENPQKRSPLPLRGLTLSEKDASRVAIECQWCEKAPSERCIKNCPAHIDIPNFIRKMEVGNWKGAARLIRTMNPFGEVCGLVCPAERLCESDCYHREFSEEPVRIAELQAWVCKQAGEEGWIDFTKIKNGRKIAIVGAGPSGLTCAYYLAGEGYDVDIYEKEMKEGGMLSHVIPSFRLPPDVLEREYKGIKATGINFKYGMEFGKNLSIKELLEKYDAIFLALGLWKGSILDIPGSEKIKKTDALSFLRESKHKGNVERGNNIIIIGGGSVAADTAVTAKKMGAKAIKIVCLENEDEMPMLKSELAELRKMNIEILSCLGPKEIINGKLRCFQCISVYDNKGDFCPEFDNSKLKEIEFDQIIFAVGQELDPNVVNYFEQEFGTSLVKEKVNLETLLIDGQTKVYAGGDIIRGAGTVVQAVADGRRAAIAIHNKIITQQRRR